MDEGAMDQIDHGPAVDTEEKGPPNPASPSIASKAFESGRLAGRRFRRQLYIRIRRFFPMDEDLLRDQLVDGLRRDISALTMLLGQKIEQDKKELLITRDLQERLDFHEMGVLGESRARLDKRRKKGLIIMPRSGMSRGRNGH